MRVLAAALCILATVPAAVAAPGFRQTFDLRYAGGCGTSHPTPDSTAVRGCTSRGSSLGSLGQGTATLRWARLFRAHSEASEETGSVSFASPAGRVTFTYRGAGTLKGWRMSGKWTVTSAAGGLAEHAARAGTYTAVFEGRGARIRLVFTAPSPG